MCPLPWKEIKKKNTLNSEFPPIFFKKKNYFRLIYIVNKRRMDDDYESKLRSSDNLPDSKDQSELLAEFERRRRVCLFL